MKRSTRRNLLATSTVGLAMAPLRSWADLLATTAQPAGPFYPVELPLDDDNDFTPGGSR